MWPQPIQDQRLRLWWRRQRFHAESLATFLSNKASKSWRQACSHSTRKKGREREQRGGAERKERQNAQTEHTDRTQRERQNTHTEREREMKRAMKMGCFPFCTNTFVFFAPKKKEKKRTLRFPKKESIRVFFFFFSSSSPSHAPLAHFSPLRSLLSLSFFRDSARIHTNSMSRRATASRRKRAKTSQRQAVSSLS